jgi:hypothetical protein
VQSPSLNFLRPPSRYLHTGIGCCRFKPSLELAEGITLGHLQERSKGLFSGLSGLFGLPAAPQLEGPAEDGARADMYIAVNASTIELPDIERYTTEVAGDKAVVLWNLGVDTLRADLGKTPLRTPKAGSEGMRTDERREYGNLETTRT